MLEWAENDLLFGDVVAFAEGEVGTAMQVLEVAEDWLLFAASSCSLNV